MAEFTEEELMIYVKDCETRSIRKKMGEGAFFDEQVEILKAAFDATWARIKRFQDYINGDGMRQAALMHLLHTKGVVTPEDVNEIDRTYIEASSAVKGEWAALECVPNAMEMILKGKMTGFTVEMGPLEEVQSERKVNHQRRRRRKG